MIFIKCFQGNKEGGFFLSRWMSIDYGEKRIGVAITDPLRMFASPFATIKHKGDAYIFSELEKLVIQNRIEKIIVGLPMNLKSEDTKKTVEVRLFYEKLTKEINVPAELYDERYSTSDASDLLKEKGLSIKDSRNVIDQVAAAVILRNYLQNFK